MSALLEITDLDLTVHRPDGPRRILESVSLSVHAGEAVGLVGESGSGKSMTARSAMRLLPSSAKVTGSITFDGRSVLDMSERDLRAFRHRDVSMIFQDPRAAINPVRTIGDFLTESLRRHRRLPSREATARATRALDEVRISEPVRRLRQYPHELSGGMLQRVMICAALLSDARVILADEPTTALDVTTQAEVVGILDELRRGHGLGMLFITHDLELATAMCDRIYVMYAGRIVETRAAAEFEARANHPYSAALFAARPELGHFVPRLPAIPGRPIAAFEAGSGCAFADRCSFAESECRSEPIALRDIHNGQVRCRRAGDPVVVAGLSEGRR
ncbi:oligopeptide/dipeptide ABC transporter ATP-binding protein [Kibdelosporangium banguiense]|uniref:Oligopeptide/dipeptide ABC transporter ATP-binding protein n=1 Tax=Kibdelosporangium banguiense TaxID=1365924 RepID=A0ABS4TTF1_9PSEU|nr:ABC transporter ATP-binding protein [Kibdelosporangium banguiense]MBP2327206.1 oligopeptide/dipeptide ABC transporter ATP-binding protein [Kibdelosporangium banguiense]